MKQRTRKLHNVKIVKKIQAKGKRARAHKRNQTHRLTSLKTNTNKQTNKHTNKQTNRKTNKHTIQTGKQSSNNKKKTCSQRAQMVFTVFEMLYLIRCMLSRLVYYYKFFCGYLQFSYVYRFLFVFLQTLTSIAKSLNKQKKYTNN